MYNIKKSLFILLFVGSTFLFQVPRSHAQVTDESVNHCGNVTGNHVAADVTSPAQEVLLYVKAEREEDAAQATLFYRAVDGDSLGPCIEVGSLALQTTRWQQIGDMQSLNKQMVQFELVLDSTAVSVAGANSPKLMLVPPNPPCELASNCIVDFDGQQFELSPKTLSASTDSLRVGLLQPIEGVDIQETIYSVDGRQVYTKKTLEPFSVRYAGVGSHTLNRTVVLTNGTYLTDTQSVHKDFTLFNAFGALYSQYGALISYTITIVAMVVLWAGILFMIRWFYRRRHWEETHVLRPTPARRVRLPRFVLLQSSSFTFRQNIQKFWKVYILFGAGIASVFAMNSFVLTTVKIDGQSMEPTLSDSSIQPVLTLPVSASKVSGSSYLPKVGDIVVINKLEHNLFDTEFTAIDNYVVKRVVGLPGDRIQMQGAVITIYNKDSPEGYVPDKKYNWVADISTIDEFNADIIVPANEIFVVGDNRDASIDSRYYGPIKASEIVGKVL